MKKKTLKRTTSRKASSSKMKGSIARHLTVQLGQVSLLPLLHNHGSSSSSSSSFNPSRLENHFYEEKQPVVHQLQRPSSLPLVDIDPDSNVDDNKDCILSQDFFCTPDYITPDGQNLANNLEWNKENLPCPKSPEKLNTARIKRQRHDMLLVNPLGSNCQTEFALDSFGSESLAEKPLVSISEDDCIYVSGSATKLASDTLDPVEMKIETPFVVKSEKKPNFVSQSAVALRNRVMPPPCIQNPYLKDTAELYIDRFGNQRSKSTGLFPTLVDGNGLSRYRTDFHEIEQIGSGNFSRVFKVLKRIDGCMYAVKHSIKQLYQDTERRQALMEVQALAALGSHPNIVGYHTSWFENEQLYIQMELCDCSLSIRNSSHSLTEEEVLHAMHQVARALQFMHERGIAHLDVKPDNIYVKNGIYKLGDFGCATLIDRSLPIEEGDARYMPQEILNDNYDNLDKVDIFSLGASLYELVKRSPLPESGPQIMNLREGKLPLLPGHSLQFQNLIKAMVDPDPNRRPSAKELVETSIFDRVVRKSARTR